MDQRRLFSPTRRLFTGTLLSGAGLLAFAQTPLGRVLADDLVEEIKNLKPGQYVWHPELSPDGPVAIVVSLPDQLCYVYRNGIRIGVSTVSSGKPGYETPTGVFTILQRDIHHHSSTYDEASMPYTERLTWSGVALHAGGLPGYPSSHGCIHLPLKFSAELFQITQLGTPVIVAGAAGQPASVLHPGMVLGQYAENELVQAVEKERTEPTDFTGEHTSIVVSRADSAIDVLVNGTVVAQGAATIDNPSTPLGEYVFILSANNGSGLAWHAIAFSQDSTTPVSDADPGAVIRRIHGADSVIDTIKERMVAGTVLVTTDLPMTPERRSGKDFVIMDTTTS
jgi:hypothetical protein